MAERNTNGGDVKNYLHQIETLHYDLEAMRADYLAKCKAVRDDIKAFYQDARAEGIEVKALKGLVKYRALERKQQQIADGMDEIEQRAYDVLIEQLGDLGRAAAERAGFVSGDEMLASV